jgi:outer membrane murein-binding lipoprotein Lpp
MIFVLIIVLVALAFGIVFAKIDGLQKACKILKSDIDKLREDVEKNSRKNG